MTDWSFLTNHARALVCIAHDPGVRLRDIATTVGITERSAYAIVTDLAAAGYVSRTRTLTAVVTATRSRPTSRYQKASGENGPLERSWTCSSTALADPAAAQVGQRHGDNARTTSRPRQRGRGDHVRAKQYHEPEWGV